MPTTLNSNGATRAAPKSRPLTLPEQIAESITLAILSGEYGPGDRILEQQHAEQFQVSRGPIREALRILEKSGVVTILAQRGAHVTRLSAKEVNDLFEIRRELAGLFFRGSSPVDPAFIERLEQDVAELERLAQDPDGWDRYTQTTMQLSRFIYSACPNEKLADIYHSLSLQTARYTKLGLRDQDRRVQSLRGWRRVINALKKNRFEEAGDALKKLIDDSRLAVLKALQQDGSAGK
ncbi:GntR family transcriptional regulator [Ramlibacter solisilvae]|uniref:GntR family transcriptional regulator n=1 Tax=Ramlibacter tataouinensis TaxID=94132 RepID=UPI0007780121|nr:GntR family transcriptional regulator [Ramlibacter tataouinensis]